MLWMVLSRNIQLAIVNFFLHFNKPFIVAVSEPLVVAALKGRFISITSEINKKEFKHWIEEGSFINVIGGDLSYDANNNAAIPLLSPLFIRIFAKSSDSAIANVLRSMLSLTSAPFDWPEFEKWHENWEVLARLLWLEEAEIDFSHLYQIPIPNGQTFPKFKPMKKRIRQVDYSSNQVCGINY